MNKFLIYPRCFTTVHDGDRNEVSDGDAELMALYTLYVNKTVDTTTWGYRKQVLAVALRLFKHFRAWVESQSVNPNVAGYNLEFIKDTLNYIMTGSRRMGVQAWLELCTEVDDIATINRGTRLSAIKDPVMLHTSNVIQKWCSWPNGFEDLLYSMYILFGESTNPDEVEKAEHHPVGIAD